MRIGGLDIGTTGCKLTVFDETGAELGKAYRSYPVRRTDNCHELDVTAMMESVHAVIREMAAQYPAIDGIGVTSFGESFVMTDDMGEPLHAAMLYTDPRGAEECRELCEKLGERHIAQITGLRPHEMYSISKMMWIRKHRPEIYAAAKHCFLIEDYVVYRLTGAAQIDYSLATRTMAFDITSLSWSQEIFDAAGIDVHLMSRPVRTGTVAGKMGNTWIVSISHDQVAAAVGAGVFDSSVAVDGAGTVECLTPIYDRIPDMNVMFNGYFSVVPYVIPGKYVAYAFSYTGGALIQWCVEKLANGIANEALEHAYGKNTPTGLLVLPHFAGAATPYMDTGSKGAILGLTTETDIPTIYRACMEGVAYEMRLNYEALHGSGLSFTKLNATGGGARSKAWMQIKADVMGLPITALKTADAGTVGSAMLTGIAIGLFQNLQDAAAIMVRETETYYPQPQLQEQYEMIYEQYKHVYSAVRPLMERRHP